MNTSNLIPRMLLVAGYAAMLIGALDPMEGALIILIGTGAVAMGTFLSTQSFRLTRFQSTVAASVAFGTAALWALSSLGGFGGVSRLSPWWGLFILPYPLGWLAGLWGPASPRWAVKCGALIGLWYLAIGTIAVAGAAHRTRSQSLFPVLALGAFGLVTIVGSIVRLKKMPTTTQSVQRKGNL